MLPTFVDRGNMIAPCPIVAARSLRVIDMPPQLRLAKAKKIVRKVSGGGSSPWFSEPSITAGLVLWYLAPFLSANDSDVCNISKQLLENVTRITESNNVVRACTFLGLLASSRLVDTNDEISIAIERLLDQQIAAQEGGKWKGEPVGIFGFGRTYSDDVFASVMALHGLIEYTASTGFTRS